MPTRQLILTLFLFLTLNMKPCSCRGIDDYFLFFKFNKSSFVGKVIKVANKGSYQTYDFLVLDKMRSNYTGTLSINNKASGVGCQIGFDLDSVYIISPGAKDGSLNIERCDYIAATNDPHFRQDSMLLNLFSKPSFTVDCIYFKGAVKNGKQVGLWIEYGYDSVKTIYGQGNYKNGKKTGKWIEGSIEAYYKNDKKIKYIEFINDTTKTERIGTKHYLYYKSGSIFKLIDHRKKKYFVFYPNGKIKEQAKLNKRKFIIGPWVKYNADGTIKENVQIDDRYPTQVYDAFWYNDY